MNSLKKKKVQVGVTVMLSLHLYSARAWFQSLLGQWVILADVLCRFLELLLRNPSLDGYPKDYSMYLHRRLNLKYMKTVSAVAGM
jgi:hypothetical protein